MTEILNPDQIAALVEAAKQGQLPDESTSASRRRHRVRKVDFTRPTKFTSDHQRRIGRAIDTFCQTAATRLSAELRYPIELEAISTTQVTWSGAQALLPAKSLSVLLGVEPIGTQMLLSAEQSFVLMAIECFLGGSPERPPRERRLTEIDWSLTHRLFDSINAQLSLVWQDLAGIGFSIKEIELHSDAGQVAAVSEPTLVVVIESRVNNLSSTLALLIPWLAIEQVATRIAGRQLGDGTDVGDGSGMKRAMSGVPVTLRAEVAAVDLPISEVLALKKGSVVRLGSQADNGISLFAENVRLGSGQPGAHHGRRAIQVRTAKEVSA